jgi:hypothetical protein
LVHCVVVDGRREGTPARAKGEGTYREHGQREEEDGAEDVEVVAKEAAQQQEAAPGAAVVVQQAQETLVHRLEEGERGGSKKRGKGLWHARSLKFFAPRTVGHVGRYV